MLALSAAESPCFTLFLENREMLFLSDFVFEFHAPTILFASDT